MNTKNKVCTACWRIYPGKELQCPACGSVFFAPVWLDPKEAAGNMFQTGYPAEMETIYPKDKEAK